MPEQLSDDLKWKSLGFVLSHGAFERQQWRFDDRLQLTKVNSFRLVNGKVFSAQGIISLGLDQRTCVGHRVLTGNGTSGVNMDV